MIVKNIILSIKRDERFRVVILNRLFDILGKKAELRVLIVIY